MKAIILAGGMGTRLRGVVSDVPKPMAPVGGKPFLEYLILQLKRWNILDVVLSVGYKKETIRSYFENGDRFGIHITYSDEKEPLGTGGALRKAISLNDDPYFIVMNGDSFFNIHFPDLVEFHALKSRMITMSLARVKDRSRYGSVETADDGRVRGFQKEGHGTAGFINGGIYLVNREVANHIPEGQVSLEGQILPLVQKDDQLFGKVFDAFFLDIGIPEDYSWINQHPEHLEKK